MRDELHAKIARQKCAVTGCDNLMLYSANDGSAGPCVVHQPPPIEDRMASMLRRLEWVGENDYAKLCPACAALDQPLSSGPEPGYGQREPACELAALLKDIP